MKYERITCVIGGEARVMETKFESKETMQKAVDRLAELEDKIESGKLDFSCNAPKDETDCVLLQAKYDIALRKYAKLRRIVTHYNVMTKTVDNEITEEAEARLKELQGE